MLHSGINNQPFRKHAASSTMPQYTVTILHFLCMVLRSNDAVAAELKGALEEEAEQAVIVSHIHALLKGLWTTKWTKSHNAEITVIADPTERCLALLMLTDGGSFKEPKDTTPVIAKFEYCMRLTFLKEMHSRMSLEIDEEGACNQLQVYFTENNYFTFSHLRSLQHMASSIAFDTQGLPRLWWVDNVNWTLLHYMGNEIAFDDVCRTFRDTENALIDIWENKILCGLLETQVSYTKLVDDLTNKDVGYSFVFDGRNVAFKDRTRLVRAVVQGEGNFKNFLMVREGEVVWNMAAVRKWLKDYAELHKLLLLRVEMLSGAPARGTELTAMTYRNTQTRSRNLLCMGGHIALLCQYSKTTALTGRDKLIPHGLDAVTSDILLQDLVLARPLAEVFAKVCFNDSERAQYRDNLFVNFGKLFTSEDLSDVMASYSFPRIGYKLTINPWRHVQTAWKRKFKCVVEEIMEVDATDDVDALQAGHSRKIENQLYGLSTSALAGAAEDVLPLFLHASTTWQKRCKVIPGGQLLPYHQARSDTIPIDALSNPSTADSVIPEIVDKVVARLTPLLTNIMDAIKALT